MTLTCAVKIVRLKIAGKSYTISSKVNPSITDSNAA